MNIDMNSSMYLVLIEFCCFYERLHDSTEFTRLLCKTVHSVQNLFFTGSHFVCMVHTIAWGFRDVPNTSLVSYSCIIYPIVTFVQLDNIKW